MSGVAGTPRSAFGLAHPVSGRMRGDLRLTRWKACPAPQTPFLSHIVLRCRKSKGGPPDGPRPTWLDLDLQHLQQRLFGVRRTDEGLEAVSFGFAPVKLTFPEEKGLRFTALQGFGFPPSWPAAVALEDGFKRLPEQDDSREAQISRGQMRQDVDPFKNHRSTQPGRGVYPVKHAGPQRLRLAFEIVPMFATGDPMPVFRFILEPEEVQIGSKLGLASDLSPQAVY